MEQLVVRITLTRDLMTTPVHTASNEITPSEALTLMMERNFRHLPIVDSRGTLLGILSLRGLLQHRTEELTHELDSLEQPLAADVANDAMFLAEAGKTRAQAFTLHACVGTQIALENLLQDR